MEYSKLASGQVVSLGGSTPVVLPFVPNFIEISNATRAIAASGVTRAWWETDIGQGGAFVVTTGAGPADGTSFISAATGGGFSTFSAGTSAIGNIVGISGITKASPAVVTTTANHNLVTGNVVILTGLAQSASTGMQQIAGIPFVVTVTGATTFTIPFNTNQSNFTALSGSPTGAFVKQILYPYLYFPGTSFITALTLSSSTTVTTSTNHNLVVGQEVAFRIPSAYGTIQLNSPDAFGNAAYGFVTSVSSATSVVVNINSTSYTAFNNNLTVAQALAGVSFPQMVTVGDNNTGVVTNASLPTTINSSTIGGAFQTNTRQGFLIGASVAGTAADVIYWRAYAHDLSL